MINWVDTDLDGHETKIVRRTLEHAICVLSNTEAVSACITVGFVLPLFAHCKKEDFLKIISDLLEMHNDRENVYYVTDFHFLVLHQLLRWATTEHNSAVLTEQAPVLMDAHYTVNADEIVERLFHDTDFLLSPEEYNAISPEEREALEMSPELFSICNGLPPHPSELKTVTRPCKKQKRGHTL